MTRDTSRLSATRFDVLVIGGGIHGLAVAYDAAQRGFATALVERGDFGSGSSFNHAKTVHGGLRSLQTGDIAKARFSILERRAMARIAPPLVTPLAFMMGTTRKLTRSTLAMRAGFLLDAAARIRSECRRRAASAPARRPGPRAQRLRRGLRRQRSRPRDRRRAVVRLPHARVGPPHAGRGPGGGAPRRGAGELRGGDRSARARRAGDGRSSRSTGSRERRSTSRRG